MHENRHRHVSQSTVLIAKFEADVGNQIAELVAQIKTIEAEESTSNGRSKKELAFDHFNRALRERDPNTPPPDAVAAPADANGRRRHAAPAPLVIPDDEADHQSETENDEHSPSTASVTTPSTASSTTMPKMTKADARAAKRAAKSAKSQRKSLKNQTRHADAVSVKASDVEHVAAILHGPSFNATAVDGTADPEEGARHPLASDKTIEDVIERNRRYVSNIHKHRAALLREIGGRKKMERRERVKKQQAQQQDYTLGRVRRGHHEEVEDPAQAAEEEEGMLIDAILLKLGITIATSLTSTADTHSTTPNKRHSSSASASSASGQNKHALLANLRIAIAEDLQKHENEQRHTLIRAGGFWRYVGRQVFERMCVIGERIDWRTGMIKKGVEGGGAADAQEGDGEEGAGEQEGEGEVAEAAEAVEEGVENV